MSQFSFGSQLFFSIFCSLNGRRQKHVAPTCRIRGKRTTETVFSLKLEAGEDELSKAAVEKAISSRQNSRQCPFSRYKWAEDGTLLLYWKRKETEKKAVYSFVRTHLVKELKLTAWLLSRFHCPAMATDVD